MKVIPVLKKYNASIEVKVSVDSIATKLLNELKEDSKHAVIIVDSIIGTALHTNKLAYVYNALNGFTNEVDFKIGDGVQCTSKTWSYTLDKEGKTSDDTSRLPIGYCTVVDIDIYRDDKLEVEYNSLTHKGDLKTKRTWVNHQTCNIGVPKVIGKIKI